MNTNINPQVLAAIVAQNERLLALLDGETPAAPVAPAAPAAPAGKVRFLTRDSREAFIAAHDWAAKGTSTRQLAEAVVLGGAPLAAGWAVGKGWAEKVGGAPVGAPVQVGAVVETAKPAKTTKSAKRRQAAKRNAESRPRRANGTFAKAGEVTTPEPVETGTQARIRRLIAAGFEVDEAIALAAQKG